MFSFGRSRVERPFAGAAAGVGIAGGMLALWAPRPRLKAFSDRSSSRLASAKIQAIRSGAEAYAPAQPGFDERYPPADMPRADRPSADAGIGGGSSAHCIRLCDGRHFPVPRSANQVAPAKMCNAMCPAAQTKVFYGSDPMHSAAADGTRYDDLPMRRSFRQHIVPDCSCTGNGPGGLAQIDVESDPTLRAGGVVATATGLSAFNGSGAYPYNKADFTPVDSYARINGDLKRKLSELKVDERRQVLSTSAVARNI